MLWSNHETNQMNMSEIANIVCLMKKLFKDQMYLKSKQYFRSHIVSDFSPGLNLKKTE